MALPALRTGRAVLPHPALRSVVLPTRGLTGQGMGLLQAEEPVLGKESIGPTPMIVAVDAGDTPAAQPFAQQASQPTAYPAVQDAEDPAVAVLEVLEPAAQGAVHVGDDLGKAVPRGPLGLGADRVLQFPQALASRPAPAGVEAVAEEIKALAPRVDQPRLARVQRQAGFGRPPPHRHQGRGCLLRAATEHHEVVGIAPISYPAAAIRWSRGSR